MSSINKSKQELTRENSPKFWGVMPAAGVGSRMGLDFPKQYLRVNDKAIIEHSIDRLLDDTNIERLIVCISPSDTYFAELRLTNSRMQSTLGGATRADSVLNGLTALHDLAEADDWVLVHDAARPCLEPAMLRNFIAEVQGDDVGGILAQPSKDTLKMASSEALEPRSQTTLDRTQIWQAQTPQMFRYGLLVKALGHCLSSGLDVTDEASAVEQLGHTVKLVPGTATNIKVTSPEDQRLAEFILSGH